MNSKKSNLDYYFPMLSKNIINTIVMVVTIIIICACASRLYIPDQNNTAAGSNLSEIQEGRILYISKCGGCHSLVLPEKHDKEQWPALVDKMEKKAKITQVEKKLILNYLVKGIKSQ